MTDTTDRCPGIACGDAACDCPNHFSRIDCDCMMNPSPAPASSPEERRCCGCREWRKDAAEAGVCRATGAVTHGSDTCEGYCGSSPTPEGRPAPACGTCEDTGSVALAADDSEPCPDCAAGEIADLRSALSAAEARHDEASSAATRLIHERDALSARLDDVLREYHETVARADAAEAARDEAEKRADRLRADRAALLNVKTTEGLTASEWMMRTAHAESRAAGLEEALRGAVELIEQTEWLALSIADRKKLEAARAALAARGGKGTRRG